jgi:hypothetical protein
MYEAVVRSRFQPLEIYYPIIRHESSRAERSTVINSPAHMEDAEALYAVRPLYTNLIYGLSLTGISFQHAINLISACSLFGTGIVVLLWTGSPLLSVLLMASWQVLYLGRGGTPDGLATLLILTALWILDKRQTWALILLFAALFVRTDSLFVLVAVLVLLAIQNRLQAAIAIVASLAAIAIVMGINRWAHYPGWIVLFRISFLGATIPSLTAPTLRVREYLIAFAQGAWTLAAQISLWVLLGIVAWRISRDSLLVVAAVAVMGHFILYPSPEVRYHLWGCVLVGTLFIRSLASLPAIALTPTSSPADAR